MSDLALGVIVLTFIAVPVSLLVLALADVIRLDGEGARRRWIRRCLYALALPAAIPLGIAAWGAAGAAHLEPLCQAYASAEYRTERPLKVSALIIEDAAESPDGKLVPWAKIVVESLRSPKGPLESITVREVPKDHAFTVETDPASTLRLQIKRVLHHENRWFRVEMERFTLIEAAYGSTVALADELSIDAGRSRYRCGIVSGMIPTRDSPYPSGDGVAKFVARAIAGEVSPSTR